jgi:deoxyribonuclease-4
MDKLNFTTAGIPICTNPRSYANAFLDLQNMNLDGLEVEFVRGVNMNPQTQNEVKELTKQNGMVLTAHGPYYINLNAKEEEKIEASIRRIIETAEVAHNFGGYSIVFHAGFYLKQEKNAVYKNIFKQFERIIEHLETNNTKIWIRPEVTGKDSQWGDLDEVIAISKEFGMVLPCIDFSHMHARTVGGWNTYDDFCKIFDRIGTEIGAYALEEFHAHLAGINYGPKGEKNHIMLEESDMNYKDLLRAFKKFDVKGVLVCESPVMEDDARLLKTFYEAL